MKALSKSGALTSEMTLAIFCGYGIHEIAMSDVAALKGGLACIALAILGSVYMIIRYMAKKGDVEQEIFLVKKDSTSGRIHLGPVLAVLLFTGAIVACASLLEPVDGGSQITPAELEIPLGGADGEEGTVTITPPDATPRPQTQADVIVDSVVTVGGAASGNPWLWGFAGQILHAAIGVASKKFKKKS